MLRFWITRVFYHHEVYLQRRRYEMTQSLCKRDTKSKSHPGMKLAPVRVFSCKHPLSRGDWLWKTANIKNKINGAAIYVGSYRPVHNPLFFLQKSWRNALMRRDRNAIESCAPSTESLTGFITIPLYQLCLKLGNLTFSLITLEI